MFFSFDGIDGVGKTTQINLFCEWLRARGRSVVTCRDPGSTPIGEAIREILLGHRGEGMSMQSEMLLYMAARAQLVADVIEPALAAGQTVVSDRFLLANVVYQGHAGGLGPDAVWQVGRIATRGIAPDLTFVLDMPPDAARARLNRELDRIETRGAEFRDKLRAGFLAEAARDPARIRVVPADRPVEEIQAEIRAAAEKLFASASGPAR